MPAQMIVAAMGRRAGSDPAGHGRPSRTPSTPVGPGEHLDGPAHAPVWASCWSPSSTKPSGPRDYRSADDKAALHPYADLAGFGAAEGRILERDRDAAFPPLASGVVSLAYSYLLSRPESAGYFQDAHHLAQRKETLMAWWVRTASDPYEADGEFWHVHAPAWPTPTSATAACTRMWGSLPS